MDMSRADEFGFVYDVNETDEAKDQKRKAAVLIQNRQRQKSARAKVARLEKEICPTGNSATHNEAVVLETKGLVKRSKGEDTETGRGVARPFSGGNTKKSQ